MSSARPRTVLLVHAYPLSAHMWDSQEAALTGAGLTVIAPHLPGFGGRPGEMTSLADAARELLELLPDKPVSLVGLSMGGYVALELLAQAPQRFGRVVLADTSAAPDDEDKQRDRQAQAQRVMLEGRQFIVDAAQKEHSPQTFKTILPLMEAASREGIAAALKAIAGRADRRPTLPDLKVPLLVLVGDQDEITPLSDAQELARLGHAELKVIGRAGHLSNLDQPQAFNEALLNFLT